MQIQILNVAPRYLVIATLLSFAGLAQSAGIQTSTFSKDGLSFAYSEDWKLTDKSTERSQHLVLTRDDSSASITIMAYRELLCSPEQLTAARENIAKPLIDDTSRKLGAGGASVEREELKVPVGLTVPVYNATAEGIRLRAKLSGDTVTNEIYSLRLGHRFINLVFLKTDKDGSQSDAAWQTIIRSLKVEAPVVPGKAIKKPQAEYPARARDAGISGSVEVRITVDEKGDVIEAEAVSGPLELRSAATQAALRAKYSPTLLSCVPVKVTGTISYGFDLR